MKGGRSSIINDVMGCVQDVMGKKKLCKYFNPAFI